MQEKICKQCGTCCRKGGPLLHIDDMDLLKKNYINLFQIFTIRKGELVHDPIKNCLIPLEQEVIKICGTDEQDFPWHCVLHNEFGCSLHPMRPLQCRALFCTDNSSLKNIYNQHRARREHVFAKSTIQYSLADLPHVTPSMLFDLAMAHEEECSLLLLIPLAKELLQRQKQSILKSTPLKGAFSEAILQQIRYDASFRELCQQKANLPSAILPLVLGRPITFFLENLGLKVHKDTKGELCLYSTNKNHYFS